MDWAVLFSLLSALLVETELIVEIRGVLHDFSNKKKGMRLFIHLKFAQEADINDFTRGPGQGDYVVAPGIEQRQASGDAIGRVEILGFPQEKKTNCIFMSLALSLITTVSLTDVKPNFVIDTLGTYLEIRAA